VPSLCPFGRLITELEQASPDRGDALAHVGVARVDPLELLVGTERFLEPTRGALLCFERGGGLIASELGAAALEKRLTDLAQAVHSLVIARRLRERKLVEFFCIAAGRAHQGPLDAAGPFA
jgi:hypothetical protein